MSAVDPTSGTTTATLWLNTAQHALVRAVVLRAGLKVVAVGSPEQGQAGKLAEDFGAKPLDDLRNAIASAEPGLLLIAAPGDFAADPNTAQQEAQTLRSARDRGVKLATLEPLPASLLQLAAVSAKTVSPVALGPESGGEADELRTSLGEWAAMAPLSRLTSAAQEAIEAVVAFGPVRSATISCLGSSAEGSLGARLVDAMDLVLALLGEPETIDAAFTASDAARNLHPLPGESLRGLHGDMTANLRFGGGRAACIFCSSHAGRYELAATLIGPGGRLHLSLDGTELIDAKGQRLDRPRTASGKSDDGSPAVAPLVAQLDQIIRAGRPAGLVDWPRVLAMAQAALLSARTGEPESPATMLKMAGL